MKHDDMPEMDGEMEPGAMMLMHPAHVPWVQPVIMILGVWLATSAFMTGEHSTALFWSDVAAGTLAVGIAGLAARPKLARVSYLNVIVGFWLLFAPLVFWTKSPAVYGLDTLIGALLIGFSALIPMGMKMDGPSIPPGWTYNPSSWPQRAPLITLAFLGFLMARQMASYQLGHTSSLSDPFFGGGTVRVLTSDVSKAWPISDAGLGAVTYLLETLSGLMGDERRWRTMPWMVAMFGLIVGPLGVASIVLIILQPLSVGSWCTFCLASAAAMLAMIPLMLDEVVAMLQFLAGERRRGKSIWHAFWFGGTPEGAHDEAPPGREPSWRPGAMFWGVRPAWALAAAAIIGAWLMLAPFVLGSAGAVADSDHVVGALVIVVAIIAMAEVMRPLRVLNTAFGLWLVLAPFAFSWHFTKASVSDVLAGVAIVVLSFPRGRVVEHYGTYDPFTFVRRFFTRGARRAM